MSCSGSGDCSGHGQCNKRSGECECFPGYQGAMCKGNFPVLLYTNFLMLLASFNGIYYSLHTTMFVQ